ncbi:MAG: DUF1302 domain-containing protein [Parvibaculaceae bacterium]|nr:DUF1302 domain-containing protein [Parvibaculaceae bacterium]
MDFNLGNIKTSVDTTVSLQAGIRTSGQDCSFVSSSNGGCGAYDFSRNYDDGNVNTKRWQPYTTAVKFSQDIQLEWENYGGFVRWKGYYDYWGANQVGTRNGDFGPAGTGRGYRSLDDAVRGDSATDSMNGAGHGLRLLDAFVYGNWEIGDNPVNVRLGNQVINWGESLFIQGGINSYLGYDVSELRTPGSEIKNAVTPMPAIYASVGLPNNFSAEAWYEFLWNPIHLDSVGTFFSGTDYFGPGGNYQVIGLEYDQAVQLAGVAGALQSGLVLKRSDDDEPSNQGQFGAKVGYYADWLNDGTDTALYYTNFHSAYPILAYTSSVSPATAITQAQILRSFAGSSYLAQYPSDIHMFGASFNTMLQDLFGGTALAGEIAYSPNMPFQRATTTLLANNLGFTTDGTSLIAPGDIINGYRRKDVITGQLQTTSTFATSEPLTDFLRADQVIVLANVGFQYLPDASSSSDQLNIPRADQYSISKIADAAVGSGQCPGGSSSSASCPGARYASSFSWGYRLYFSPQYNNAFGTALTISPLLVWSHDVTGYSAGPIGPGFIAGVKKVSVGFNAAYLSNWNLNVQWTSAFGNKFRNYAYDKDFAAATLSYAF